MKDALPELAEQYASVLRDYLAGGGEAALQRAYELGRRALTEGLGVLDMAVLLHRAVLTVRMRGRTLQQRAQMVKAMEEFFLECLSPFEMAHRGVRDANIALRRLNESLEEQVKRIAHAFHDEAGQLLASVHLALKEIGHELPPSARERLQEVRGVLNQIEAQLRHLSHELRPTILDDLGLLPALKFLAEGVSARTGTAITVEGSLEGRLPLLVESTLYRIVQEALTNVAKHAQATHVRVQLHQEAQRIRCAIRDDGIGFDVPTVLARRGERGLGLLGIQERLDALGGTLQVTSPPAQGTELTITIPVETADAAPDPLSR